MKNFLLILLLLFISSVSADVIYLKNGAKLEGDIIGIAADSVSILTKGSDAKLIKVATNEIARSEKEKGDVTIAKSVRTVGFGCLGGIMGAAVGITAIALGNGFDDDGRVSITVISALVIIGILIGTNSGGK